MTAPLIGAQLDNYRIVEKIGEGGMGAVYRAVDVMLERDVALKFLRPELSREPELVQRFRSEAVVLARLNHHFIAPIYGLHRYGDELFIAMEYVPGETLDSRLKRVGRFSPDAAMHVTSMVLQALDYAHRLGVVHRDIKPGNVILAPNGTAKVMDFGIARVLGTERHTRAGSIVGTIPYMAPEQVQGLDADQRADLYSAGTMFYEMLAGHVPFRADTDWALMQAQINQPAPPLAPQIGIPQALDTVVLRALEKDPGRRFQNATEFQRALEWVAREGDGAVAGAPASAAAIDPGVTTVGMPITSTPRTGVPAVAGWEETRLGLPTPLPGSPFSPVPAGSGVGEAPSAPPAAAADTRLAHSTEANTPAIPAPVGGTPPWTSPPAAVPPPFVPQAHPPAVAAKAGAPDAPAPASVPKPAAAVPPLAAKPKPAQRSKGATGPIAIAGLAVLGLLVGGGWYFVQRDQPPAEPAGVAETAPATSDADAMTSGATPAAESAAPSPQMSAPPKPLPGPQPPDPNASAGRVGAPAPRDPSAAPGRAADGRRGAAPMPGEVPPPPAQDAAVPPPIEPVPPAPAPPTPAASAVPPAAADVATFKGLRMVRPAGPEVEVEVQFSPSQLAVTNIGGRNRFHALDYNAISSAVYSESRHARVFVRTTRYWLTLRGAAGWQLRLRLERDDVKPVIEAFEKYWGHTVQRSNAEEPDR